MQLHQINSGIRSSNKKKYKTTQSYNVNVFIDNMIIIKYNNNMSNIIVKFIRQQLRVKL